MADNKSDNKSTPHTKFNLSISFLWLLALLALVLMILMPFRFTMLRGAMLAVIALLWLGGIYLLRRSRWSVLVGIIPIVALAGIALLPGKPVDGERLRGEYVHSLQALKGTLYVWGGETHIGIDCSGLIRLGMIDADVREGVATANPALIRTAINLWWNDCSAKALGEQYRGWTRQIAEVKELNDADYTMLRPGDIAVMESGVHTLAYIGDRTWIQADPLPMRVVTTTVPSKEGWFVQRARLLRWTALEPSPTVASMSLPARSMLR